jgi:hypothetical protein
MKNIIQTGYILLVSACLSLTQKAYSQELQQVQNSFNKYQQNTLQEKVFVHTDKSTYVSGDIIWFKVYCVDGGYHKPLDVSKVVYVDVVDNAQNAILQAKISLKNGSGNGSFPIPVTVLNGNYKLRAYTNWMKNFGPDYFFEKQITVINTLRPPETIKATTATYDVQFFPEGGNLVAGINSNVAFKGAVINQQNDTVARFQPLKFGMGHFSFTPASNNIYKAIITVEGNKIVKNMPVVNASGYVMQLTDAGVTGNLQVRVSSNSFGGRIYLFVHSGANGQVLQGADINNGVAQFTISKARLNEGVSHITIFNGNKQPICERLYFKRPKQAVFIAANADMAQYALRKKVNVQVTAKNAAGALLPAGLSMAVFRVDSLQNTDENDINSYLWLASDLRGGIESAGYYLKNTSAEADAAADNLMLTQGWRKFQWENVLQNNTPAFTYLPEYNGHIVTAKVTDTATSAPANSVIAFMAVPGKRVQLYAAKSDTAGKLLFNTKQLYGPNEIVVQANTETESVLRAIFKKLNACV